MTTDQIVQRRFLLAAAGLPKRILDIIGGVVSIDDRFFLTIEGVQFFSSPHGEAITLLLPRHIEEFTPRGLVFTEATGWKSLIGTMTNASGSPLVRWLGKPF